MCYLIFEAPIGNIKITFNDQSVYSLVILNSYGKAHKDERICDAQIQLEEYFSGERKKFNLPSTFSGTDFQKSVWQALLAIPYGETRTYHDIARQVGRPKAYRAVATAIAKNPIPIIIPCHRVVRSDGQIGGYSAGAGVPTKLWLINFEKANK